MAKIITFFDSYGTLASAFKDAGYEVQAAILSNDDERDFYREKFGPETFVFIEDIKTMCTCGVRNRAPHGLVGKLPETVYDEPGNNRSQVELLNQLMRFIRDTRPHFVLLETTKEVIDNQEKFKHITDTIGSADYDCFVLLHPHKSFILCFNQVKNRVEAFDFPEIKSDEKVTKEYTQRMAEAIGNALKTEETPKQ